MFVKKAQHAPRVRRVAVVLARLPDGPCFSCPCSHPEVLDNTFRSHWVDDMLSMPLHCQHQTCYKRLLVELKQQLKAAQPLGKDGVRSGRICPDMGL